MRRILILALLALLLTGCWTQALFNFDNYQQAPGATSTDVAHDFAVESDVWCFGGPFVILCIGSVGAWLAGKVRR
jgi:hypothetical protein